MMSIYEDFPIDHDIWNVSNPQTVRAEYHRIFKVFIQNIKLNTGSDSEIYLSSRKNKKYMVFNGYKMIHFGDIRYQDYTKHQDEKRRERYFKRFHKFESGVYTPFYLSLTLLW